jgi:sulfur carrier protein
MALRASATRRYVKVVLTPQGRELTVERAKRVQDLLAQLSITPGTVLVIRGDRLLTEDERLSPSDEIELRSVVSGG